MEEVTSEPLLTPEQEAHEIHYAETVPRNSSNGRHVSRLLLKADVIFAERLTLFVQFTIMR